MTTSARAITPRAHQEAAEPERVLVLSAERQRAALVGLAHLQGYEVVVPNTPFDAIDALLDDGDPITCAWISRALPHGWGRALHAFLAKRYPEIRCVMLDE